VAIVAQLYKRCYRWAYIGAMRGHTIAVELYFVQPLRPRRWLLDRLGKPRRDELRKGHVAARPTGFDGLRGGTPDDT
jgi:hypothetical protein